MFGSLLLVGGQRVFAFRLVAVGMRLSSAGNANNKPLDNLQSSTNTFLSF